ncbi:MAG: transposase [Anaerolineae bacterium]|nr:transposase [Phycisphaerae bacterium]
MKLFRSEREHVRRVFADVLPQYEVDLISLCIGAKHFHMLARFAPLNAKPKWDRARWVIGPAKGASARKLSKEGIRALGGIWAKRCKVKCIADRRHQVRVAKYIRDHVKQGAVVLSLLLYQDARRGPTT